MEMTVQERLRWDAYYRERRAERYPSPDPILFEYVIPAGLLDEGEHRALDLACGVGQNGLWLAKQGYIVDLVDVSREALMRVRSEATRQRIRSVNLLQKDLDTDRLETNAYDLACVFRYLNRALFPQIMAAMRSGGRVIYQGYNTRYLRYAADFPRAMLLEPGELAGCFADWEILYEDEPDYVSQIVVQKP
jgi:tellurite methyltransferase